jgi:hypothetical protein
MVLRLTKEEGVEDMIAPYLNPLCDANEKKPQKSKLLRLRSNEEVKG